MATVAITPDQDAVIAEVQIAAPPARVFSALTDPRQLTLWWGSEGPCKAKVWEFDARVGGKWRFEVNDPTGSVVINAVSDFKAGGEIVEYDPPRVLAYTWIANWHDDRTQRTVVRWELKASGAGTKVKVTHSGLTKLPVARKDYTGGWPGVVEMLKKFVEK